MAISLDTIETVFSLKDKVRNKTIISVGDHTASFTKIPKSLVRKWGLDREINSHLNTESSREFLKRIFQSLGFTEFVSLDISKGPDVDYYVDLSRSGSALEIGRQFGVVIDNGTSIYVGHIFNSLRNITHLCDKEGIIITNQDQLSFNRFPQNPTPEFLIDFMACHGFDTLHCHIDELRQRGLNKKIKDYEMNYLQKHYYYFCTLNLVSFFKYIVWIFINYFSYKKTKYLDSRTYYHQKENNFRDLIMPKANQVEENRGFRTNLRINYPKMYQFLKSLYFRVGGKRMSQTNYEYENYGRTILSFVFQKNHEIKLDMELNSTSLYYTVLWQKMNQ